MLKYLRIAVTALCLSACALLIALWVRSYYAPYKLTRLNTAQTAEIGILSNRDGLVAGRFELAADPQFILLNQQLRELQLSELRRGRSRHKPTLQNAIAIVQREIAQYRGQMVTQMMSQRRAVPHWLPLLVAVALVAAPWINWRFSLRTLLIATTLVAVGLGVIVLAF
jgi:hypothetical protein